MEKEKCVMCEKPTPYSVHTNIDMRIGYIEGMGQLCLSCFNKEESTSEDDTFCIPKNLILKTPNDSILGSKIRRIFNTDM
jgi:hypothetical protein